MAIVFYFLSFNLLTPVLLLFRGCGLNLMGFSRACSLKMMAVTGRNRKSFFCIVCQKEWSPANNIAVPGLLETRTRQRKRRDMKKIFKEEEGICSSIHHFSHFHGENLYTTFNVP